MTATGVRDPNLEVMDVLVQTSYAVTSRLSRAAAAHDLSLTQLRVLGILRDRQPRMADVADHVGLERSSVSGLIDRAVRRGLVRRDASADDGRAVRLSLAPEGQRLASALTDEVAAALAPMLERLGPAEQHRLAQLLEKMLG